MRGTRKVEGEERGSAAATVERSAASRIYKRGESLGGEGKEERDTGAVTR